MSMINSTVEIKEGKVVFSEEVLSYFENLRNEENSEWIDKYFKVLSDENNLSAEKYNLHHIRPCCTFKDDKHKNRSETQSLGDKFKGNIIKLSIYNHVKAHYFLWKIFNDLDSKCSIMYLCGLKTNIDNLSEDELNKIALIREECAKTNQTEEEKKRYTYKYNRSKHRKNRLKERREIRYFDPIEKAYWHIDTIKNKIKTDIRYKNIILNDLQTTNVNSKEYVEVMSTYKLNLKTQTIDKKNKNRQSWRNKNKNKLNEQERLYYKNNKDRIHKLINRLCLDPITNKFVTYQMLNARKHRHKDLYKNIILKECLVEVSDGNYQKIINEIKHKNRKPYDKKNKQRINELNRRLCFDPIKEESCTYSALTNRKKRHKEDYKNVIVKDCLI